MNLRRLLGTSVVLACALAVFAAPIIDTDDNVDIEARDDWTLDLASRDIGANAWPEVNHYTIALDRRGGSKARPAPAPKLPAPKLPPPQQPPVKQPPSKQPPTKQPPPKQPPSKLPPAKQPPPKQPPSKQPPTKQPPSKQPPSKQPPSKQPPSKQPPSKQPPPQQPPPKSNVCSSGGKVKRAFSTTCDKASLTLGGVTRSITKVADQGNSAVTYKVDGGWPDPTNGAIVTAYAKTGKRPGGSFAEEAKWLGKTDQLLAEGAYEGHQFIVFHGVSGKVHITATSYFGTLVEKYLSKGDIAGCQADVKKKLDLVVKEAKYYVDQYKVLHTDIQPGNILWDNAGNDPTLIDWGRASEVAQWSAEVESRVRKQAEYSHLQGDEKICLDLRG